MLWYELRWLDALCTTDYTHSNCATGKFFLKVHKENLKALIINENHFAYTSGSAIAEEESKYSAKQLYNVHEPDLETRRSNYVQLTNENAIIEHCSCVRSTSSAVITCILKIYARFVHVFTNRPKPRLTATERERTRVRFFQVYAVPWLAHWQFHMQFPCHHFLAFDHEVWCIHDSSNIKCLLFNRKGDGMITSQL